MQQQVMTAAGRRLAFTATPDEYGRVVYQVAKVGAFTVEPDAYSRAPDDDTGRRVYLRYGRVDGPIPFYRDQDLPDAPVVCTVVLAGGATFGVERLDEPGGRWLSVCRVGGADAPDGTRRRTADIVRALVTDWLARDDHEELRGFHAWHLAPSRIADAGHNIDRLHRVIAPRMSELAAEFHRRGQQLAIRGEAPAEPAQFPDPQTRDGQAILALHAELERLRRQHRRLHAADIAEVVQRWLGALGLPLDVA
ncbi:hypothetical protein [Krasilnikovia sp. MM14-A1259]|uniref:hypothetical protein n=1 Tax=Krasilnikovia sp. MM14-A1259 TaxID=3373539 RepID=UPI003812FCCA